MKKKDLRHDYFHAKGLAYQYELMAKPGRWASMLTLPVEATPPWWGSVDLKKTTYVFYAVAQGTQIVNKV